MIKALYNWYYTKFPQEMVSWWMTKEAVRAKVTTAKDGSYIMWMEGEKYPFPGYPRGHLLYGTLSKLKHELKNQFFNENWWRLERGERLQIDEATQNIFKIAEDLKYDMMPYEKMAPAIRELYENIPDVMWRKIITYILQEDDGYRFRFQWMTQFLDKNRPFESFEYAMEMLENAEVVEDMKERVRLIKRVMLELWKDPVYAKYWIDFLKDLNLGNVKLSKADKYFFRAKYFKVDYPYYEY